MSTTVQPDANGRNADGTFAPGNAFARMHKRRQKTAELRDILVDAITPERLQAIAARLIGAAESGDLTACRLVLGIVGKDPETKPVETELPRRQSTRRDDDPERNERERIRFEGIRLRAEADNARLAATANKIKDERQQGIRETPESGGGLDALKRRLNERRASGK